MAQDLIVFSHIRWHPGERRPHHIARRLAEDRRVFFFEEPLHREQVEPALEVEEVASNLYRCQPQTPERVSGFHDKQLPYLDHLLAQLLADYQVHDWIAWFYTPTAEPLIHDHQPLAVIYDCMSELHGRLHRPGKTYLPEREVDLLQVADLVLTDGAGLQQVLQAEHDNVHCFLDEIDTAAFQPSGALPPELQVQAKLPRPRLGYYGTIDRRVDTSLLAAVAQARPDWQLVMIGPVTHLEDEWALPQAPNIHYLGPEKHEDLPGFVAHWDLCLLPWVVDEGTRWASPARVLEYLASGRPVVSTPVAGVASGFEDVLSLADSPDAFIQACEQALQETAEAAQQRRHRVGQLLAESAWDQTVPQMQQLMQQVVERNWIRSRQPKRQPFPAPVKAANRRPEAAGTPPVVVLGAGPTGLSAAYHLGEQALLLEQREQVGGHCRSIEDHGFTFDHGGHVLFSKHPYVHQLYQRVLGDNLSWQARTTWIYSHNQFIRYPLQESLYGLPAEVVQECLLGIMNLAPRVEPPANPAPNEASAKVGGGGQEGSLESSMPLNSQTLPFRNRRQQPRNLEDFILETWGMGFAKHFLLPYNRKFWTLPLRELQTSALQGSPWELDRARAVAGALKPITSTEGPDAYFGYPRRGGMQALADGFLPHLRGEVRTGAKVVRIVPRERRLTLADGTELRYQRLVSTLPIPALIHLLGDEVPAEIQAEVARLRRVSMRCVNLGIGRENLTDKHWIYFPQETVFHRVFAQGSVSPYNNAPGGFGLTCEMTYSADQPLPLTGDALIQRCIQDCIKVGLIGARDPIWAAHELDLPDALPVPDQAAAESLPIVQAWLAQADIFSVSRDDDWQPYLSDRALLAGRQIAEQILGPGQGLSATG